MSWERGEYFVLCQRGRDVEWYGVTIGNVLAVIVPNTDFFSPDRFKQINIPKDAERISLECVPEMARCYFAVALVATQRLL